MVRSGLVEVGGREPRLEPRARTTFPESGRTWTTVGNAPESRTDLNGSGRPRGYLRVRRFMIPALITGPVA
jgi:hypothetical protein